MGAEGEWGCTGCEIPSTDWEKVRRQLARLERDCTPEEAGAILRAAMEGRWEDVLTMLDSAGGRLPDADATQCVLYGIHSAPPERFAALLDRLPGVEYVECETYSSSWNPGNRSEDHWEIVVRGTAVMHAVAENKPEHLELLLERRHDVNAASPWAAAALMGYRGTDTVTWGEDFIPFQPYTARPESVVRLESIYDGPDGLAPLELEGATPLALALLMGHPDCARVLVEHGAWLEESPGVSQTMWLFGREEDVLYQQARRQVLSRPVAHRPVLHAVGKTCSPAQLEQLLKTHSYSRQEMIRAARAMLQIHSVQEEFWQSAEEGWENLCRRLALLGDADAEVLCAPEVAGQLFLACGHFKERELKPFLPYWTGRRVDLSDLSSNPFWLGEPEGENMLRLLAAHSTCVMARDTVGPRMRSKTLKALLRYVNFLPSTAGRGVSGLTMSILNSGDLRLIERALRRGLIPPEETAADLLRCQREEGLSPVGRSLLLSAPRRVLPGLPGPKWVPSGRGERWFPAAPPADPLLARENWTEWIDAALQDSRCSGRIVTAGCSWKVDDILLLLCLAGMEAAVEYWLDRRPQALYNTGSIVCDGHPGSCSIILTALSAAAFGGHTGLVNCLLERGAPREERLWGNPTVWVFREERYPGGWRHLPADPLLMALVGRHEDTVRLLRERGAGSGSDERCANEIRSLLCGDNSLHTGATDEQGGTDR